MTLVYDLWFEREYPDRKDTELHIGIYETDADAAEAISRLRDQPGFKDFPEGFNVYPVPLGRTGWLEGFVTEFVPAKERNATVMSAASTDFLNVDIDLRGDIDDVAGFLKMVEPSVVVLNHTDIDASIELAEDYTSLDTTMLEIIRLIEALPPDAKKVWSRLKYRRANIGIQTGAKPHAAEFAISAKTLEAMAALGFDVAFTVYSPTKD